MNFKSLKFALGFASVSFVLSACGGAGGSVQNPARGSYIGDFVNSSPNTDSGTLSFVVDPQGNVTNGVITDTTNPANSGTFTGFVDKSYNAHLNITVGKSVYPCAGTKSDVPGSSTVYDFAIAQTNGSTYESSWTQVTKK